VLATRSIKLDAGEPAQIELVVPANRSIAGTVHTTSATAGTASVTLVETGRSALIDDDGHYVFRGLKPGTYTVEATIGGRTQRRLVELPVEPLAVRFIDFP